MRAITIAAAAMLLALASAAPALAQTGHDLFQQALVKERADGDLRGAIEIYERIATEFAEDRTLAAKALVQMGQCYEKLSLREAQDIYRSVISDFPEQREEVAIARERLASVTEELAELSRGPTFTKIDIPSRPQNGVLSPDGMRLAFVSEGSVWVVPVHGNVAPDIAGEPLRITGPMGAWDMGNQLAWSGDGEWIAFSSTPNDVEEIYVVSSAGGELKKIPGNHARAGHAYNFRLSLTPDGERLAFVYAEPDRSENSLCAYLDGLSIHMIPVQGGEATRVTPNCSREPAFSPDGEHLAYVTAVDVDDSGQSDLHKQLWVVPTAGGTPVLLVDSTQVRSPVWSPDGEMIAVVHEPGGGNESREVWVVAFSMDGTSKTPLARIELPHETRSLLAGWTRDNELGVHLVAPEHNALYSVPVTGGKAVQVTPDGMAMFPRWTPDGGTVVFRGSAGLAAVPAGGGEVTPITLDGETKVNPGVPPGGGVHVSPDGKMVVFAGLRPDSAGYQQDIWTVPFHGGRPTQLTRSPTSDRFPCWSADGTQVAFLRYELKEKGDYPIGIYAVPAEGGDPVQLASEADSVQWSTIAYSPDGRWLAYFSNEALKVMPVAGGEGRVIAELEGIDRHSEVAWSPDARKIAYTDGGKIWVVSLEGGVSEEVKIGLPGDTQSLHIDWAPDGEKLVFSAYRGGDWELWLISDFLPKEK